MTQLPLVGRFLLAGTLTVIAMLSGCESSKEPQKQASTPAAATATQNVYIEFEGPWAFAADPKDANTVIAIAPKAQGHHDLFVKASNDMTLPSGVYTLAVPARGTPGPGTPDSLMVPATTDAASFQHALDAKGGRYVIRLPKPDAYVVAGRLNGRVGDSYPPTTDREYATEISLVYGVNSLVGFSLSGTADTGTPNLPLLKVDTPMVRVVIEPSEFDDPADPCHLHSRASFHDLTKLLNVTKYVDFSDDPEKCRQNDPQNPKAAGKRASTNGFENPTFGNTPAIQEAGITGLFTAFGNRPLGDERAQQAAAIFLFGHPYTDCKAPILNLTVGP